MKLLSFGRNSLGYRIFFAMISLVLLMFVVITAVTYLQSKEQIEDYNTERLARKETQIKKSIDFILQGTSFELITKNVPFIFRDKIFEISGIQGENITFYNLEGNPLISSADRIDNVHQESLTNQTMRALELAQEKRYVEQVPKEGKQFSYSYINTNNFKPIAILQIQYEDSNTFINKELRELIFRLAVVNLIMLCIAIAVAYFLVRYITQTLHAIGENIKGTQLDKRNQKINNVALPSEILTLVNAYNGMIDQMEESAAQLAQSEREAAWREMAKQVAHEIKNPLTPMRLTVQSFERKFDADDPDVDAKIKEYSNTLIQQIDTMSSIASAFSNFADMPAQQSEILDVPKIVHLSLEIFSEHNIHFSQEEEEIYAKFDRTQLIRVVTNLVKNAIQATKTIENPTIAVDVNSQDGEVQITVMDNGIGIIDEHKPRVFEPKFTTKTSGMGLGLAMVKNILETYNGSITFTSEEGKGTVFKVTFPK